MLFGFQCLLLVILYHKRHIRKINVENQTEHVDPENLKLHWDEDKIYQLHSWPQLPVHYQRGPKFGLQFFD
jgi:hypothetical protein